MPYLARQFIQFYLFGASLKYCLTAIFMPRPLSNGLINYLRFLLSEDLLRDCRLTQDGMRHIKIDSPVTGSNSFL